MAACPGRRCLRPALPRPALPRPALPRRGPSRASRVALPGLALSASRRPRCSTRPGDAPACPAPVPRPVPGLRHGLGWRHGSGACHGSGVRHGLRRDCCQAASGWTPGRVRRRTPWQRAVRPERVRLAGRPGSGAVGGHDPSPLTYFALGGLRCIPGVRIRAVAGLCDRFSTAGRHLDRGDNHLGLTVRRDLLRGPPSTSCRKEAVGAVETGGMVAERPLRRPSAEPSKLRHAQLSTGVRFRSAGSPPRSRGRADRAEKADRRRRRRRQVPAREVASREPRSVAAASARRRWPSART
ncbi:hypothetical protein FF36_03792 [Frankia torreyi]|uniref:Uncharacterized protein n=1 Tax=Frankia torreyi TaxID=1856 RepID=A0A0D8BD56_9ACTN|nr:hypothetical protein FF36_03792 [Frankia torreyi]KQM05266.1 hypothetical protein FF86_101734 [Frankia sp. CpI1-P]